MSSYRRVAYVTGMSLSAARRLTHTALLLGFIVSVAYIALNRGDGSAGGAATPAWAVASEQQRLAHIASSGDSPCCRLVLAIPAARKHMERVDGWVSRYGGQHVHWVLFHYDDSGPEWEARYSWYRDPQVTTQYTWRGMMKFGFFKRWLTPAWIAAADPTHVLLVDSDAGLDGFDLHRFVRLAAERGISLAQPAVRHEQPGERSSDHPVSRVAAGAHLGRWTGFVEGGPLAVFTREAWLCTWAHMHEGLVSGWGIDLKWCGVLRNKCGLGWFDDQANRWRVCAVLDRMPIRHLDERSAKRHQGAHYEERSYAGERVAALEARLGCCRLAVDGGSMGAFGLA